MIITMGVIIKTLHPKIFKSKHARSSSQEVVSVALFIGGSGSDTTTGISLGPRKKHVNARPSLIIRQGNMFKDLFNFLYKDKSLHYLPCFNLGDCTENLE